MIKYINVSFDLKDKQEKMIYDKLSKMRPKKRNFLLMQYLTDALTKSFKIPENQKTMLSIIDKLTDTVLNNSQNSLQNKNVDVKYIYEKVEEKRSSIEQAKDDAPPPINKPLNVIDKDKIKLNIKIPGKDASGANGKDILKNIYKSSTEDIYGYDEI